MNLTFTEEQEELRKTVRRFLEEKSSENAVRASMATADGYDRDVWTQLAQRIDLLGLAIPEVYGGLGYGFTETMVVLEEMGRALLCAPYFSSVVLAANLLLACGDEEVNARWLPGIAGGTTLATVAIAEDPARWQEQGRTLQASFSGGEWNLTGEKLHVIDGHIADLVLVTAQTPAGISVFEVRRGAAGFRAQLIPTMDQTRKQARLLFDGTPTTLIGSEGESAPALSEIMDIAAIALAIESVGGAQRVLDMSVAYSKQREQFGRLIGSFQAIKHRCADMLLAVDSARSAAYLAGWAMAERSDEAPALASLAKAYCTRAYFGVAADGIQIHGGIGFTWEHPVHLYFKRAKSSELLFGEPAYHEERLAERVGI